MIRKYLVCGKQMFLASKKLEDTGQKIPVCELLLPIDKYWEVDKLLKRIDYMISANDDAALIAELSHRVFRKVVKYAVQEKDRIFLHDKLQHG